MPRTIDVQATADDAYNVFMERTADEFVKFMYEYHECIISPYEGAYSITYYPQIAAPAEAIFYVLANLDKFRDCYDEGARLTIANYLGDNYFNPRGLVPKYVRMIVGEPAEPHKFTYSQARPFYRDYLSALHWTPAQIRQSLPPDCHNYALISKYANIGSAATHDTNSRDWLPLDPNITASNRQAAPVGQHMLPNSELIDYGDPIDDTILTSELISPDATANDVMMKLLPIFANRHMTWRIARKLMKKYVRPIVNVNRCDYFTVTDALITQLMKNPMDYHRDRALMAIQEAAF